MGVVDGLKPARRKVVPSRLRQGDDMTLIRTRPLPFIPAVVALVGLTLAGPVGVGVAAPAHAAGGVVVVHSGGSIQDALDRARPGSTVVVEAGTYAEQLTVTTDRITLVGRGAILVPPTSPVPRNLCSGLAGPVLDQTGVATQTGICVTGSGVELADFDREHREVTSVGRRVRDVVIRGFDVRGFTGPQIALVGASHSLLLDNDLAAAGAYGALSVGSTHTRISHNVVTVADVPIAAIGICADDAAPAVVDANEVSGYGVGLCVQTQGADFRANDVHDNCVGVYVDAGIGAVVRANRISTNNLGCDVAGSPPTGIGVWLDATVGTQVRDNLIVGHRPTDGFGALFLAGPAAGNVVIHNVFNDNTLDVVVTSTGPNNVITQNHCTTSEPAALCR
jgi:nitrous oxidase accessory protein NosD